MRVQLLRPLQPPPVANPHPQPRDNMQRQAPQASSGQKLLLGQRLDLRRLHSLQQRHKRRAMLMKLPNEGTAPCFLYNVNAGAKCTKVYTLCCLAIRMRCLATSNTFWKPITKGVHMFKNTLLLRNHSVHAATSLQQVDAHAYALCLQLCLACGFDGIHDDVVSSESARVHQQRSVLRGRHQPE